MDDNGAQDSHMDVYAQFDSLKPWKKKFLKSNHWFSLAVQSPASRVSLIAKSGWIGWQDYTAKENRWLYFKNFFVYALIPLN